MVFNMLHVDFYKKISSMLIFLALLVIPTVWADEQWLDLQTEASPGEMIVGSVKHQSLQVTANNQVLPISPKGYFVFGLGRDVKGTFLVYATDLKTLETQRYVISIKPRVYKEQFISFGHRPKKDAKPNEEVTRRIEEEAALVKKARSDFSAYEHFADNFIWPVKGPITGVYGSRRIHDGVPKMPHSGLDIAAPTGTPIKAPTSGLIRLTHKNMLLSGGTVVLDHGYGIFSTFIHMHKISVKDGQWVNQGDKIGTVGATGRATGPHLHWALNWYEERLDPHLLLK
jgi:murein DD-endopeptidase MepM/ murein hydrolase activator NlpD